MKLTKTERRALVRALQDRAAVLVRDVTIYARRAEPCRHPRQRPDAYPNRAFWAGAQLAAIGRLLLALDDAHTARG